MYGYHKSNSGEQEAKTSYPFVRPTPGKPIRVSKARRDAIIRELKIIDAQGYEGELSAIVSARTGECESVVDAVMWNEAKAGASSYATALTALKGGLDEVKRSFRDAIAEFTEAA